MNYIAEALTEAFGERCPDYGEGCHTCEAWREYDRYKSLSASPAGVVKPLEEYERQEAICTDAAMSQWERSLKRADMQEKDRVRGAVEAYKRQALAFHMLPSCIMSAIEPAGVGVEAPPPSSHVRGLSDAQVEAVLHLVESRLCIIWAKADARQEFADQLRALEPVADAVEMDFTSDDDALEFLKLYGHEESRNGVIRGDWRSFDADCRAAVGYLCDEWDFVFEDTGTPAPPPTEGIHARRSQGRRTMTGTERRMKIAVSCGYWCGDPDSPKLRALLEAPNTKETVDAILTDSRSGPLYPDEWYADKDNRMEGRATGHLRWEGGRMVWVSYGTTEEATHD